MELNDQELAIAVFRGDESAARLFDQTYRPRMIRTATYILGYRDNDVEDVVQETFTEVFPKLDRYDHTRASLYTWMARICVLKCYKKIRNRHRTVTHQAEEMEGLLRGEADRRHIEKVETQEKEHLMVILKEKLEMIQEPCRTILELRDIKGESYASVAATLKVPIGTVMSRLARCRQILKEQIAGPKGGNP